MLLLTRSYLNPWLLFIFILSLTCGNAHAYAGTQNDHPVTLTGNTTLRGVFKAIKQQTGYAVMYSTAATALNQDEKVNVNFKETPLDDVLAYVLRGKELEWKYSDDVLVIHKKEPMQPEKKIEGDSTVTPAMITGKVTDANGAPVIGATIMVKGTSQGAVSDKEGNYSIPKVPIGATLLISSVGYARREITVSGKRILTQLNMDISKLDETQIIAYGTTTQRYNTGNTATIKAKDIERQPVANPLLALQGRVPGLYITQNTGISGGGVTVRIQGQNSIFNGSDPLFVVDGVPIYYKLPTTGLDAILGQSGNDPLRGQQSSGNPLSYLNPADIESISILKDADATAIYGSRAANGAVLITTKKGKEGPVRFNMDFQQGWGKVTRTLKMLNTQQYLEMRHEGKRNDNATILPTDYDINGTWDTTRYTDWQKALIGSTAHYTNINASFSGGTALAQYLVGGTYHRETTVFPYPSDFADQKASVHFSISSRSANQKFRLLVSGNYMVDNNQLPRVDLTQRAIQTEPDAPPLYVSGTSDLNWAPTTAGASAWTNPLIGIYMKYVNKTTNLLSNLVVSYQLLPGLEVSTSLGYTNLQTNDFAPTPLLAIKPENRPVSQRRAFYGNRTVNSWIIEPQLRYRKRILKGNLETILGGTVQENNTKGNTVIGLGYNNDDVMKEMGTASSLQSGGSNNSQYKYNAFFGRLNYNWQDKYIINLTARRDGSSRFGTANRFHNFGAAGAAWIFSNEHFIRKTLPFLSFGKLRTSYGITGNDQIADYNYLSLYSIQNAGNPYQGSSALTPFYLSNPRLQWEETRKLQIGLELGFAGDRILLNTTYVRNRSSNQLLEYILPNITGYSNILRNFPATVQNSSWEFAISTTNVKGKNITWTSDLNITIPRNKLVAFPGLESSPYASTLIIGQPLGVIRAYHFLGVDPTVGDYQFADKNGKATATPAFEDATVLLNLSPKFYGGLQNSITYNGFEVNFLLQFVKQLGDNVLFNGNSNIGPGEFFNGRSNQPVTVLDHWEKPGDVKSIRRYGAVPNGSAQQLANANTSDAGYTDASYIRLKNLAVAWRLPVKWLQITHMQSCQLFLQSQNLLTFTNYKGLDPENQGTIALPPLKVFTVGIKAGL